MKEIGPTSQRGSKSSIKLHRIYAAVGVDPTFPDRFSRINCVSSREIISPGLQQHYTPCFRKKQPFNFLHNT